MPDREPRRGFASVRKRAIESHIKKREHKRLFSQKDLQFMALMQSQFELILQRGAQVVRRQTETNGSEGPLDRLPQTNLASLKEYREDEYDPNDHEITQFVSDQKKSVCDLLEKKSETPTVTSSARICRPTSHQLHKGKTENSAGASAMTKTQ
jgi:hypothetical protein